MTTPDTTNWLTATYNAMQEKVSAILLAASYPTSYLAFCLYETTEDPVRDDLADWVVQHPDFAARFAEGQVEFVYGYDEKDRPVTGKGYLNPTWADVVVEAERSCRARGAPELDHVFLESVELLDEVDGIKRFEMRFGS